MTLTIPISRQQRITNTLLLNASFIDNLGLMHGKMGIAIYFFHLARATKNQIYEDYAGELIDEIYEGIYTGTPLDYENGLAGIGWGIEYLVQNKFIDANTNEVLDEFDNRILNELTSHASSDIGILTGISGYVLYFLIRLNSNVPGTIQFESIRKSIQYLFGILNQNINNYLADANNDLLFDEPEQFDMIWEYPAIIWILSEMIKNQIGVKESEQLIVKLISPIIKEGLLTKLHSHRLLFALALEKLKHVKSEATIGIDLEKVIQRLLLGIDREGISKELADQSVFLRNGTSGIVLIYKQLFLLTNNLVFNEESEYWNQFGYKIPESNKGNDNFYSDRKDEKGTYGILNGLAGINLFTHGEN